MGNGSYPAPVRTVDELTIELRRLKAWAGNPSITQITRRVRAGWREAGRPAGELPARSTVGNCFLLGRRRPNVDLFQAVVAVLVGGDPAAVAAWSQALRGVLAGPAATGHAEVRDRLPPPPETFVGRADLLDRLAAGAGRRRATVLAGLAGIGKTATAAHLARRLTRGRPGARVLFADLRGFAVDGAPASPAAVLETFLRLLGVPGEHVPAGLSERSALFRREVAGRSVVLVLDDAAGEDQIRPILPGIPGVTTLITSRHVLPGLAGAVNVTLPVLTAHEAVELLRGIAGRRDIDADPQTAGRIVDRLGRLPLALSIVGRHMREHRHWTLADYHPDPAAALAMEGGVRAVLAASDRLLPQAPKHLLRLLALHPALDFDATATAALADRSVEYARCQLDKLVAASLLEPAEAGQYRFHALVRHYAGERMHVDQPPSRTRQALQRLSRHRAAA